MVSASVRFYQRIYTTEGELSSVYKASTAVPPKIEYRSLFWISEDKNVPRTSLAP